MKVRVGLFLLSVGLLEEQAAGICKCTPVMVLTATRSCHSLLKSDDAICHILKGAPQQVNAETSSLHKSLLSHEVNQKKPGEQAGYLCMVYFMGYKVCKKKKITSSQIAGYPTPLLAVMSS